MTWVPDWWAFALLSVGTYRLFRFIGWDTFPPMQKLRFWVTGAEWHAGFEGEMHKRMSDASQEAGRWWFRRPVLAELLDCPFCAGLWLSIIVYLLWAAFPTPVLAAMTPLAISGVVGVIAKNAG